MSTLLTPTVHERLARCGQRVDVDGLAVGATVELDVDGAVSTVVATGGDHRFTVPGLNAGANVRARQDAGAGFTPYSPTVTVEDAFVPPGAPPSLPEVIGACSQCVLVTHATPGAGLELRIGSNLVGSGVADSDGSACVGVDLRAEKGKAGPVLLARQVLCGAGGPDAHRALAVQPPLPKPAIGDPIFGCQRRVPISGAQPGAKVVFETDGGADLGSACSCWQNVDVFVARALAVGESVRVRCLFDAKPCDSQGSWSAWRLVVAPDEQITPEVMEALVEGDQVIRVANQIAGASLLVRIAATQGGVVEEFGPRPTSDHQEVALNAPLTAGNVVTVVQTLCGVSMESDPVVVQGPPPEVLAPLIVPPLYECGQVVRVSGLHPGAHVRVLMDAVPIGLAWAGLQSSVAVPAAPALTTGRKVTAVQTVGTTASPPSEPVVVDMFAQLHAPRLLEPLGADDREVRVSGVTPGAHVAVLSGGMVIGELDAGEPIVRVPIGQLAGGGGGG
jgi:hypothetical protein